MPQGAKRLALPINFHRTSNLTVVNSYVGNKLVRRLETGSLRVRPPGWWLVVAPHAEIRCAQEFKRMRYGLAPLDLGAAAFDAQPSVRVAPGSARHEQIRPFRHA